MEQSIEQFIRVQVCTICTTSMHAEFLSMPDVRCAFDILGSSSLPPLRSHKSSTIRSETLSEQLDETRTDRN